MGLRDAMMIGNGVGTTEGLQEGVLDGRTEGDLVDG